MEKSTLPSVETPAPIVQSFFEMPNETKMTVAAEVANILGDFIEKQKLYSEFNGKKHIHIEGWATLGTILNLRPVEDYVKELDDGSFEAKVKLIDMNGVERGEGSGFCGTDEANWKSKPRFARRSMAITRAAGKAYRFTLAWIPKMKGYEGTPAEEMDFLDDVSHGTIYDRTLSAASKLTNAKMRVDALTFINQNKDDEDKLTKMYKRIMEATK